MRDRFVGAGTVASDLAAQLGLIGLAGRASGQALDLRIDLPCAPYAELEPAKCGRDDGDVAARVAVRFDELAESVRLVREIVERLALGAVRADLAPAEEGARGVGLVEGWRGPVLVALTRGRGGRRAPLSSARSVVAELARARARDHRQHRSGLSADQQVVQLVVQRARPLAMLKTLGKIGSIGVISEPAPKRTTRCASPSICRPRSARC